MKTENVIGGGEICGGRGVRLTSIRGLKKYNVEVYEMEPPIQGTTLLYETEMHATSNVWA